MRKLLSADFSRLLKSREFYIAVIFMCLLAIFRICSLALALNSSEPVDDDGFFLYALVMGIVMAAFVSLFAGADHSNHTIRNKLVVGHRRSHVYISHFIICTIAGWIFCSCYLIIELAISIPMTGGFTAETKNVVGTVLCVYLLTASYSSIFVWISMLNANRAVTSVICILSALALLILGVHIQTRLMEPEQIEMMTYSVNEEMTSVWEDNPNYISNAGVRKAYELLNDALCGGQTIQLSGMLGNITMPSASLFIFEALTVLITNGLGIAAFSRKDLK